jgi:hypothetical protein
MKRGEDIVTIRNKMRVREREKEKEEKSEHEIHKE